MAAVRKLLRGCFLIFLALRPFLLAVAVAFWLAGYFYEDGWEQRSDWLHVQLVLLLNVDLLVKTIRETRWLWAVGGLLAYQALSRLWSEDGSGSVSSGYDVLVVFQLTTALVMIGRREGWGPIMIAWLTVLAVAVTLVSLFHFYGPGGHELASGRFRNIFIYPEGPLPGLNAVLTGLLCVFGTIAAAWFARCNDGRLSRDLWLVGLAVLVFGILATQSRGAMLAAIAGFAVLIWFLRGAMWPALVTTALSAGFYFAAVLRSDTASELIERGSTGRLIIYEWFVKRMSFTDVLIGRGMATDVSIPEEELGWFVDHPHSAYVTQFVLTGLLGLGMMLCVIGWPAWRALGEARRKDALWLALIASGAVAVLFDCGQMFSIYSAPRLEYFLVVVPAALVMGRGRARGVGRGEGESEVDR